MYKVVSSFRDAKDNNRLYAVGDEYPATNIKLLQVPYRGAGKRQKPFWQGFHRGSV